MHSLRIAKLQFGIKVPPRMIAMFLNDVADYLRSCSITVAVEKALRKLNLIY